MICPQCQHKMKNKSYAYYSLGAWDCDYPDSYHEEYKCPECKMKYLNGKWIIPDELKATEKQIKTASFINLALGYEVPPHTKKLLWKFINQNLQDAIIARQTQFEEWCDDNADWLPEYF